MGCGEFLELQLDGSVACVGAKCPRPSAAQEILAGGETEHIVTFDEFGFTIRHPLQERLDDALMGCGLHRRLASSIEDPPEPLGLYRITLLPAGNLHYQLLQAVWPKEDMQCDRPGPDSPAAWARQFPKPGNRPTPRR
jgi:hypothetical protein